MPHQALGLIETNGIDGALAASQAASAGGQVVIVSAERVDDGRMVVRVEGDPVDVQKAVEAGARAADRAGQLLAMHMIPRPDSDSEALLPYRHFLARYQPSAKRSAPDRSGRSEAASGPKKAKTKSTPTAKPKPRPEPTHEPPKPEPAEKVAEPKPPTPTGAPGSELESMSVVELRRYARTVDNLPIKGREISRANKEQLLTVLRSVGKDAK